MSRFDFLPSYHYEDDTDGIINNPAELSLRDYTIEGNCGKNLIDESKITLTSGYYFDSGGEPSSYVDKRFIRVSVIRCEPNTTYTLSSNLIIYTIWCFNGNTSISRVANYDKAASRTFTTPENCNRLRISLYNTSGEADTVAFEWIQLEYGKTATAYDKYKEVGDLNSSDNKYYIPIKVNGKNLIEPRTTNIILDSPLGPGKSISKKADNLPEITLNKGSNIITVDTEVEPKSTTYQYYTY